MKDRIRLLQENQKLTQQSFAKLLEISPAQLCGIYNGRTKPTLNIVDAIHRKFPQVRIEWLLYGFEPMYIEDVSQSSSEMSSVENAHPTVETLAFDFSEGQDHVGETHSGSLSQNPQPSAASQVQQGSLFDQPKMPGVNRTLKKTPQDTVKYIDKQQRKITEIRIFYDDQTWETFVPKK